MFVVVVFHEAKREFAASMRTALLQHKANCLAHEPGCQTYDVSFNPIEPSAFLLYQVYENEAAYLAHKELPHYCEFRLKVDPWTQSRRVLTYELLKAGNA